MPTQVTNYQCPACTGPLHFAGGSGKLECEYCGASYDVAEIEALYGKLECEYCGASYDVAEIEALYAQKEEKATAAQQAAEETGQSAPSADDGAWDTSGFSEDWGAEGDSMRAYSCPSCGAELTAAARSSSATRPRRPPPAPTAATPRWCRDSSPDNCARISWSPSS